MLFGIASVTLARLEAPGLEAMGDAYFLLIVAPALILSVPFQPLLWQLHLMIAPGWFAWPSPLGFCLVYAAWTLAFFAASFIARPRT